MAHVTGWQFLYRQMTRVSVVSHQNDVGSLSSILPHRQKRQHLLAENQACLYRSFQDWSVEFRAIIDTSADSRSCDFSGYRIYRKRKEVSLVANF